MQRSWSLFLKSSWKRLTASRVKNTAVAANLFEKRYDTMSLRGEAAFVLQMILEFEKLQEFKTNSLNCHLESEKIAQSTYGDGEIPVMGRCHKRI